MGLMGIMGLIGHSPIIFFPFYLQMWEKSCTFAGKTKNPVSMMAGSQNRSNKRNLNRS